MARLVQLGIRQARYRGRVKTLFQLLMAAAVANLTLVAGQSQLAQGDSGPSAGIFIAIAALLVALGARIALPRRNTAHQLFHRLRAAEQPELILAPRSLSQMACSRPRL